MPRGHISKSLLALSVLFVLCNGFIELPDQILYAITRVLRVVLVRVSLLGWVLIGFGWF